MTYVLFFLAIITVETKLQTRNRRRLVFPDTEQNIFRVKSNSCQGVRMVLGGGKMSGFSTLVFFEKFELNAKATECLLFNVVYEGHEYSFPEYVIVSFNRQNFRTIHFRRF